MGIICRAKNLSLIFLYLSSNALPNLLAAAKPVLDFDDLVSHLYQTYFYFVGFAQA